MRAFAPLCPRSLAALCAAGLALGAGPGVALGDWPRRLEPVSCLVHEPSESGSLPTPATHWPVPQPASTPQRGPCNVADSVGLLPPNPASPASFPPVLLANFGLLLAEPEPARLDNPADSGADGGSSRARYGYGLVCEDMYGGKIPDRLARDAEGRLFIAGLDGVYVGAPDGCGFSRAAGSVAFKDVAEVAFDPVDPKHVFALTRLPALALHESHDGGASFAQKATFAPEVRFSRLFVAAAPPHPIYLTGYAAGQPLVLARSDDGGGSFTIARFEAATFGHPNVVTASDGPSPDDAATLFVAVGTATGADEIWRSSDAGHAWTRVQALLGTEVRAGFTFGATAADVYIAGRELFPSPVGPGAHLYVSHDGGQSFAAPLPTRAGGPHYRCLGAAGARLWGCGGDPGDDFLFGYSDDQGASWTTAVTLTDIVAPRACTNGRCYGTALWLCQSYGVCAPDLQDVPEQRDAQSADGSGSGGDGDFEGMASTTGGCGCQVAGVPPHRRSTSLASIVLWFCPIASVVRRACRRGAGRRRSS